MISEPKINDIMRIICVGNGGQNEEKIGRLEGYRNSDYGQYIQLKGHQAIFAPSIKKWEILKSTDTAESVENKGENNGN